MSVHEQAAVVADSQQAEYFRQFLAGLRAEVESDLSRQVRRLTASQTSGDIGAARVLHRAIRAAEGELRAIVQMVDALNGRFPAAPRQPDRLTIRQQVIESSAARSAAPVAVARAAGRGPTAGGSSRR